MVNQYQILELLKFRHEVAICHADLPFFFSRWADPGNEPGFPAEMERAIMQLPVSQSDAFDTVYRIGYPFTRSKASAARAITFIVTELGLSDVSFAEGDAAVNRFCEGDDLVITPSNWSRKQLIEYGFPPEKVRVIPHGVSSEIYFPLSKDERKKIRKDMEISDEDFVFLNVGALSLNKGVQILIEAFRHVRQYYGNARLMLKDSSGLYGTTVSEFVQNHMAIHGALPSEVTDSIYLAPSNLSLREMRLLYGCADVYVSPYIAEGFNIPVLEAIACGTPAIVTGGGATDDFCDSATSLKINSDLVANIDCGSSVPGYRLDPHLGSLLEQMGNAITGTLPSGNSFESARRKLVDRFSWTSVAKQLTATF
jgi:glycosyltransferase involved in cell wall biosynthesis